MNEWETICESEEEILERIAAPGGWIYKTTFWIHGGGVSLCFVPDPDEAEARNEAMFRRHQEREWEHKCLKS